MANDSQSIDMKRAARIFFSEELEKHGDALHPVAQVERDRQTVKELFDGTKIDRVLDISSGTGFVAKCFQEMGTSQLVASDFTDGLLKEGKARIGGTGIHWIVCDAEHLSFQCSVFDVATCRYSFHHYPNPVSTFTDVHRVLDESGYFLLVDPTPPPGEPQYYLNRVFSTVEGDLSGHNKFYSVGELVHMADSNGFQVVRTIGHTLKTRLLLPGFQEEFRKIPSRISQLFGIEYGEESKRGNIQLPITYLLLRKESG